jgi:hypothetical protein
MCGDACGAARYKDWLPRLKNNQNLFPRFVVEYYKLELGSTGPSAIGLIVLN